MSFPEFPEERRAHVSQLSYQTDASQLTANKESLLTSLKAVALGGTMSSK